MPPRVKAPKPAPPELLGAAVPPADVTAVLVAHNGMAWLPDCLTALAASSLQPLHVVAVDTGSDDGSDRLLETTFGSVLRLPRSTGFGAAVAAALAAAERDGEERSPWIWLLHDDLAVEPDALAALLEHAAAHPSCGVLGPKVRDWADPRVLVEVGVTTDRAGNRETGLERREYDQGQHDAVRDVLAVGTAGALVRRDVWDGVGGLDPALPVFRDDLDLGWRVNAAGHRVVVVPDARARHARAATTGRRPADAAPGRPAAVDRRHALYVLLAHADARALPLLVVQLTAAVLLRAAGYLLTRQPGAARDELAALCQVLGRPGRLGAARRARAATRTVNRSSLRPLFASRVTRLWARAEVVGGWLSGGAPPTSDPVGALGDAGPEGPDALADLELAGPGLVRRLLHRPGTALVAVLALVALGAERHLLPFGGGLLSGGRLLPPPGGVADLWRTYAASWHPVSVGSTAVAPPYLAALALLGGLLLGKAWLAVDLVLLAMVPVAGAGAYLCARRVAGQTALRVWAAATWALLPVATGGVATGRLDVAAVAACLPWLGLGVAGVARSNPRAAGWWRAWAVGLGLSAAVAFAPPLWPVSVLVLLVLAVRCRRAALALLVVAAVPLVVLLPWSWHALARPGLLLAAPGRALPVAQPPPWHLLLLSPGGPGSPPLWLTAGVVLAALGALLRRDRRSLTLAAWSVAVTALLVALVESRLTVRAPGASAALPVWPGVALQVAAAALLTAALVAADGARERLARVSFGWRQLAAALVAVAAAVAPVWAAGAWLARGADRPLQRHTAPVLPAFARAELSGTPGLRALVVRSGPAGRLSYDLVGGDLPRLGSADLPVTPRQRARLDAVVADLLTPSGSDAAEALATRGVRYVALVRGPGTDPVALVLDTQPGLSRREEGTATLWSVVAPTARLSLLTPTAAAAALRGDRAPSADLLRTDPPTAVPAGPEGARALLPAGAAGRLLVLADASDAGWRATVDGRRLPRRQAWGWAQAFLLPAGGGRLVVWHSALSRHAGLAGEGLALIVVLVLAAPAARHRRGLELEEPGGATHREGAP